MSLMSKLLGTLQSTLSIGKGTLDTSALTALRTISVPNKSFTMADNADLHTPGSDDTFTVANEATDTTCFPLFVTAATGDLGAKTVSTLTFNSNTGAIGATTLELGHATDTTLARVSAGVISVEGVVLPSISSANTITNKRVQPRSSTAASGDISPDMTVNVYQRTALSATININAPTGTPVLGEVLVFMLKSTTSARTLTMNATYKVFGAAFPATVSTTKRLIITAQYDGTDWLSLWAEEV